MHRRAFVPLFVALVLPACGAQAVAPADDGGPTSPVDAPDRDGLARVDAVGASDVPTAGTRCWPGCLERLFAGCPASAACTSQTLRHDGTTEFRFCYPSGTHSVDRLMGGTVVSQTTYTPSDAVCWTATAPTPRGYNVLDPAGAIVATIAPDPMVPSTSLVTCDGTTTAVDESAPACAAEGATVMCADGVCPGS